jgi:hypothetical protein
MPGTHTLAPHAVSEYTKALAYILTAALGALAAAMSGGLTTLEVLQVSVLVLGAVGVYLVPLVGYLKGVVAFAAAGVSALVAIFDAGGFASLAEVPTESWLLVIVAALGGVGVVILPNTPPLDLGATRDGAHIVTTLAGDPEAIADQVARRLSTGDAGGGTV